MRVVRARPVRSLARRGRHLGHGRANRSCPCSSGPPGDGANPDAIRQRRHMPAVPLPAAGRSYDGDAGGGCVRHRRPRHCPPRDAPSRGLRVEYRQGTLTSHRSRGPRSRMPPTSVRTARRVPDRRRDRMTNPNATVGPAPSSRGRTYWICARSPCPLGHSAHAGFGKTTLLTWQGTSRFLNRVQMQPWEVRAPSGPATPIDDEDGETAWRDTRTLPGWCMT